MSPFDEYFFLTKYLKKLIGRTEIEDALKRLDKLTQEGARMATAQVLKVAHAVDDRVRGVTDDVLGVDNRVASVGARVAGVDDRVASVDERIRAVDDKVAAVFDGAHHIFNRTSKCFDPMRLDGKEARLVMQQAVADVDQVKRSSSSNHIDTRYAGSSVLIGDHLRQDLRGWISPPDPSTNHNIACRAHHKGTATWFFQGSIYNEWKSTPSLLWIHGKRKFLYQQGPDTA
jgi:hypothetical protein